MAQKPGCLETSPPISLGSLFPGPWGFSLPGRGHNLTFLLDTHLVVGRPEPPVHVLVIQNSDLESEILLEVLEDHDKEGELDAEGLLGVGGAGDVGRRHVTAADLKSGGLDVRVSDALDVTITDCGVGKGRREGEGAREGETGHPITLTHS
jgi:hypothetical protein